VVCLYWWKAFLSASLLSVFVLYDQGQLATTPLETVTSCTLIHLALDSFSTEQDWHMVICFLPAGVSAL